MEKKPKMKGQTKSSDPNDYTKTKKQIFRGECLQ